MTAPPLSAALAGRIAAFPSRELPAEVRAAARLCLLDTLGAMLAAADPRYPTGRLLATHARAQGGRPASTLVGQGRRASPVAAALANGTLAYAGDIEPHHAATIQHAPAVAIPAALAVAEATGASGARFLAAAVLGIEVACRVSAALDPTALYERGFHPTAVCGAFGAAAAAGRLLRLPPPRQAIALGLALQQASGLLAWATDPTEQSRPLNPGLAARNGVTAAELASLGLGGPPAPFDGPYDAFTAFSGTRHPGALLAGWGRRFHVGELSYKRYASCAFTHPGLDALLALAAVHGLTPADVERIVVRFPRSGAHVIDAHPLRSHCAQYVLPVGLVLGGIGIDDVLRDRSRHPEVARLRAAVTLVADPALDAEWPARYTTEVELHLRDGRRVARRVAAARGTPENPMTPAEVREKFRALTRPVLSRARAEAIRAAVERVDRLPAIASLTRLLQPRVGRGRARRSQANRPSGRP